jgi:hypothetical protein
VPFCARVHLRGLRRARDFYEEMVTVFWHHPATCFSIKTPRRPRGGYYPTRSCTASTGKVRVHGPLGFEMRQAQPGGRPKRTSRLIFAQH